jgi:N-methylhydantoinase A
LKKNFENEYKKLYGRVLPNAEIEAMTWIVSISTNQKSEKKITDNKNYLLKSSKDKMRILSIENSKYIDVAHYERKNLKPGFLIKGGCIISEQQTTTIVSKKFQTKVLSNGYLEITEIRGAK